MTYKPQQNTPKKKHTAQEYLLLEEQAPYKSEFHNGEIRAMAGGTREHSLIKNNINGLIMLALMDNDDCRSYDSDLKIRIKKLEKYLYPDGSVVCGKEQSDKKDATESPKIIIEVVSESSSDYDRTDKFLMYQELPSFMEYVLISQEKPLVQTFVKKEQTWESYFFKGLESVLLLQSLNLQIPLSQIYNKVEF